jgi:probable rRNA maturation factor
MQVAIDVINKQRLVAIDRRRVALLANAALAEVGRAGAEASIVFVGDRAMRRLNREYRGKDSPTDVLSFPAEDEGESVGANIIDPILIEPDMIDYIGDVVISAETALRQAEEAGHSFEREVSELVIHGVLHLCGYDHEADGGEMNRLELKLRRKLLDGAAGATRGR